MGQLPHVFLDQWGQPKLGMFLPEIGITHLKLVSGFPVTNCKSIRKPFQPIKWTCTVNLA